MLEGYKCVVKTLSNSTESTVRSLIKENNHDHLNDDIIDLLYDEFNKLNPQFQPHEKVFIPILKPFFKKHNDLIDPPQTHEKQPGGVEPNTSSKTDDHRTSFDGETFYKQTTKKLQYRLYPYTFSRAGETIEAVIRVYNDMNLTRQFIDILVREFTKHNPEAAPPKLLQTAMIPVLLPFCYRHENGNVIFDDGKTHTVE